MVLRPGASRDIESMVVGEIRSVIGADMAIRVHVVPEIPVNPRSGKEMLLDLLRASREHFLGSFAGVNDADSRRKPWSGRRRRCASAPCFRAATT